MEISSLKKKCITALDSISISQEIAVDDQIGTILFLGEIKRSEPVRSTVDRMAKRSPWNISLRVRLKTEKRRD